MHEKRAMELCMELALKGWGQVHPNPLVGAVILRGEKVVGTGYHRAFGQPHAEVEALSLVDDPAGCTCVVNLEPCNHEGKTPPCTSALIEAGIKRVVYGCSDPHTVACGGAERLKLEGVDVVYLDTNSMAERLNAPFLHNQRNPALPYVAVKLASSIDGFIADEKGKSRWVSGPVAGEYVHWLRAGFDAIAVGRRTLEKDNPHLTVRGDLTPRVPPSRIVFTGKGPIGDGLRVFEDEETRLYVVGVGPDVRFETISESITTIAAETLEKALKALKAAGCNAILVEGGGVLAGSLVDAGLVNRLYWIQAPIMLRAGIPAFANGPGKSIDSPDRWDVVERRTLGDDTLLVLERDICLRA